MEVITKYDTQLEKWELKENIKFIGSNTDILNHEFGISPQDPNEPNCCYFNVAVEKHIRNEDIGIVFLAKTSSCYKVRNNNKTPTIEFCFDLIDDGTFEFAKIFNKKKKNTYVFDKKVPIPKIEEFRKEIQESIDFWVRNLRSTGLN